MLIPDVNVLLYAFRHDLPEHEEHAWRLRRLLLEEEPVGVSELVLSGFVRIVTNHRVYPVPSTTERAISFCETLLAGPAAVPVRPGARHWAIFADLCRRVGATANVVPDAYHAALAIENGATWVTGDRGFARFPGLRWATLAEVVGKPEGPDQSA